MTNIDPKHFEEEKIAGVKELMKDKFEVIVNRFVLDSEKYINSIKQGVNENDAKKISSSAHPLKSSSGSMGCIALSEQAKKIELMAKDLENDQSIPLSSIEQQLELLDNLYNETKSYINSLVT